MLSFLKKSKPEENHQSQLEPELAADALEEQELREWKETLYDAIRTVKDPEKPFSLEDLDVVQEELISVSKEGQHREQPWVSATVRFKPTVPHCSLATLIGLCLRTRLERTLPAGSVKLDILVLEGSHQTASEVSKQINDKERVAAAMENPNLRATVEECIKEE